MAFQLENVVPWGRSYEEYERMFALTPDDLSKNILGCADGPASFNAEARQKGIRIISCDPLYHFSGTEIQHRIDATFDTILEQARMNASEFVWSTFISVTELGEARMRAMQTFLKDYEGGLEEGRYVAGSLPNLPFDDGSFDLALCSHYLFLYSDHLTENFHFSSMLEMLRVADEVRIFPLLSLGSKASRHVTPIVEGLRGSGFSVSIEPVRYEFQRGGNKMMRVQKQRAFVR